MLSNENGGHLVTFRNDRLGGRLISLVNTLRLARDHDLPFKVRWHETNDIARVFNDPRDFFDEDFVERHFISAEDWSAMRGSVVRLDTVDPATVRGLKDKVAGGAIVLVDRSFGHDRLGDEDAAEVSANAAAVWTEFPLAPPLAEEAARIRARIGAGAMAYHVRRGDLIHVKRAMNRPWPQKYVFDEIYFRHIARSIEAGRRPVLFSDDADTIARYRERFPTLIPAAELYEAQRFAEGPADLLELIAMSCCDDIVAPSHSGFSSTAATLGGITHTDILSDFDAQEIEAAYEDMLARVSTAGTSQTIDRGHVAQSLAHADPWLVSQDRVAGAERLIAGHVEDGLDISYLYPRLIALRLDLGDLDGALAAHALMEEREVYFGGDVALSDVFAALAAHEQGDAGTVARLCRRAIFTGPTVPAVGSITSAFLSLGVLDSSNFLPADAAARSLWKHPAKRLPRGPGVRRALGAAEAEDLPDLFSINPILWDWAPLLRPVAPATLRQHPHRRQHEVGLEKLELTETPGALALAALYDTYLEADDTALERLREQAEEAPDAPMVHHRLSVAATLAREPSLARDAAEKAAELAPEAPAHIAWRGIKRGQDGDPGGELSDLSLAVHDMGFTLPRMPLRLAAAGRKAKNEDIQSQAHDLAVSIAPRDGVSRYARAVFREQTGDRAGAMADLDYIMRLDIVPPAAQELHDRISAQLDAAQ